MTAQMRTTDWRGRRCHRRHLVLLCQSRSLRGRGLKFHRQEGVATVMQGPINDTGEEPVSPCPRVWQNCPCHGCSPAQKSKLNFMLPHALECFRRHLAVPTGSGVCGGLQRSRDGWVRSPVRRPDHRAAVNSEISSLQSERLRSNAACVASPRAAAFEEATRTYPEPHCVLGQQRW